MRDNQWLGEKMYELWENYFCDVPRQNKVVIKFGRRAHQTLGSIKYKGRLSRQDPEFKNHDDKRITEITITRYFADPRVPDKVVLGTIAHEMIHYAHGFHSPLKQQYEHPHQGGLIKKEMEKRGLEQLYALSKKWIKEKWQDYLKKLGFDTRVRRSRSRQRKNIRYIKSSDLAKIIFKF